MNKIYILKTLSEAEEYIKLKGNLAQLKEACIKSEIQYLSHENITFQVSEQGGLEIPDIICQEGIWFVSSQIKELLDSEGIDYIFYKPADIVSDKYGIHENFWIMVPPRIDCIDLDKSKVNREWDFEEGLVPILDADNIQIMPKLLGRFEIFKIFGIADNNIYIKERIYQILNARQYEGVAFILLQ